MMTIEDKWRTIADNMDDIQALEASISYRDRFNHSKFKKHVTEEIKQIRLEQVKKLAKVKDFYAENRDELVNTLGDARYTACKNVLEQLFTNELDDAIKKTLK